MTSKEFFDLVKAMRSSQKDYFKTRSNESLRTSKDLEKQVDMEIVRVEKVMNDKQMKLF